MADAQTLDKAYQIIITCLAETGQAPHSTELAAEMGCSTEEGRQIVHDLAKAGPTSIRLNPDTDWISTVPPLSLIPTPYRITVDGQQKWYAQ